MDNKTFVNGDLFAVEEQTTCTNAPSEQQEGATTTEVSTSATSAESIKEGVENVEEHNENSENQQDQGVLVQETLFSFVGSEEPEAIQPKSSKKDTAKTANAPAKNNKAAAAPAKPKEEEKLDIELNTIIRYGGENISVTDYFSEEEILEGITIREGDKAGEKRPIVGEDLRERMEDEYGELMKGYVDIVFNKEKNMIVPMALARKKGGVC